MARTKRTSTTIHLPRPKPVGRATIHARGATFAQLTTHLGTGQRAPTTVESYPFSGPDAAVWAQKAGNLDPQARSWVARAVANRDIRRLITGNTGTIPELVLVGRYLARGYVLHRTLFFQEKSITGFRLSRPFVADVAVIGPGGTLYLMPVDGAFFHARTLLQQLDARRRNSALASLGKVIVVPDTVCTSGVVLDGYLRRAGAP